MTNTNLNRGRINLGRPIRVGIFGDSTGNGYGYTYFDRESIGYPVSGTLSMYPDISRFGLGIYAPVDVVALGAIPGETVQDMLNRSGVVVTADRLSVYDVISKNIDVVVFHGGSINDYARVTESTSDAEIYTIADKHIQLVDMFIRAGVFVLDCGTQGFNGDDDQTERTLAIRRAIVMTNTYLKQHYKTNPYYMYVDVENVVSINGSFINGYSDDSKHLNRVGGMALGMKEFEALSKVFSIQDIGGSEYDTDYLFANASTIPSGYSLSLGSSFTKESESCSLESYELEVSATENSKADIYLTIPFKTFIDSLTYSTGDLFHIDLNFTFTSSIPLTEGYISLRALLYNSDNSAAVIYGNFFMYFNGETSLSKRIHLLEKFRDTIGTSSYVRFEIKDLPAGSFKLNYKPDKISVITQ